MLKDEHRQALKDCPNLQEIIFFFDGDKAGSEGVDKYAKELRDLLPNITISQVDTPKGRRPQQSSGQPRTRSIRSLDRKQKTNIFSFFGKIFN